MVNLKSHALTRSTKKAPTTATVNDLFASAIRPSLKLLQIILRSGTLQIGNLRRKENMMINAKRL